MNMGKSLGQVTGGDRQAGRMRQAVRGGCK